MGTGGRQKRPRSMRIQTVPLTLAFALAVHLAGCDRPLSQSNRDQPPNAAMARSPSSTVAPAPATSAPATPTPSPKPTKPLASRDPAEVLAGWARAVEARDWKLVRAYWGNFGGDSGFSDGEFAGRWDVLKQPKVTLGPAEAEGAAGSSYYDAPVMISDGKRRFAGQVLLRRINDIDGAGPEDLRWHIQSSTLTP